MPVKNFEQKNKIALINLVFIGALFIAGIIAGGGREGKGLPIFMIGYMVLFIVNLVLCILGFAKHNKSKGRLFLVVSIALIIAAVPSIMLLIMFTGGIC